MCIRDRVDIHSFVHQSATGTKSSACTACHGSTDLPTVHDALGCFCHTSALGFSMAGEMGPLLAAGTAECVDCHKGPYSGHGFAPSASGHSTTTYGKKGAYEIFDGSEGVTLKLSLIHI